MKDLAATLNPLGYMMLLVAVVSYGLYSVFAQKATQFSSTEKTYAMIALGAIVFTGAALVQNAHDGTLAQFATLPFSNREFLTAILYLGIGCSVVAFLLYNIAITAIGTNRSAPFAGIATVVTVIAGVSILNESYSLAQVLGTAMVLGGVYLASVMPAKRKEKTAVNLVEIESPD
jgi:drug/metabolite transporter (DMT)-like permease